MDNKTSPDAYTRVVAAMLTEAKQRSGKSFAALASETGISRATIVRLLAGERDINLMYLRALCAALGLDASALLNDADKHL